MTLPENTLQPEETTGKPDPETAQPEVEFPEEPILPEDFTPLVRPGDLTSPSRARRRRARRTLLFPGDDDRITLLDDLARRAFPSFEFFIFAFLSGILLGAGYLLDSQALLLLGLLLAPLLTPWVGLTLSAVTGSWRFFFQTVGSLFVAFLLIFLTSALVGMAGRLFPPLPLSNADVHTHLWWPDLLIVAAGAILLELAFVRGERHPILPSIMLAYGLVLPVGAAGFGLGIGAAPIWPDGVLVFLTHLALATLIGIIVLAVMRFKPQTAASYLFPILLGLVCVAALVVFTGLAGWIISRAEPPTSGYTPTPLGLASPTPGLPPSATPGAPTMTDTLLPSNTPLPTLTDTPTPSYAIIEAASGGGAYVRTEPGGGTVIITLVNGTLVEVLPEIRTIEAIPWVRVRTTSGAEGWVLQGVLSAATPAPTTIPTLKLTSTP
jgi:Domain of unknown function (DUF389)/Bacterial SH3 domain